MCSVGPILHTVWAPGKGFAILTPELPAVDDSTSNSRCPRHSETEATPPVPQADAQPCGSTGIVEDGLNRIQKRLDKRTNGDRLSSSAGGLCWSRTCWETFTGGQESLTDLIDFARAKHQDLTALRAKSVEEEGVKVLGL